MVGSRVLGAGTMSTKPAPVATLQRRLRTETRTWHERIEGAVPLLDAELDRPRYRRYLEALAGYYRPVEAMLLTVEGWASIGIDLDRRRKVPWIERDLQALGAAPLVPLAVVLPRVSTLARAAGCLYVLEGSTLGSRVVGRHLEASIGVRPDLGAAFFHGYGDATGAMWEAFVQALDALAAAGADEREVIDAARETFETFEAWLRSRDLR